MRYPFPVWYEILVVVWTAWGLWSTGGVLFGFDITRRAFRRRVVGMVVSWVGMLILFFISIFVFAFHHV